MPHSLSQVQVKGFQVNALLRKSWAYQRKNISMNMCILLAPIVIAALLGVFQILISNLLSGIGSVCSFPSRKPQRVEYIVVVHTECLVLNVWFIHNGGSC